MIPVVIVVSALGSVKKGMIENIKKVSDSYCDRDPEDLHAGICTNPQEGSWSMNRITDLSNWFSRCMVCTRLIHKKNTSKDCDRRENNNNNDNNNNNNDNNNKDRIILGLKI